MLADEAWSVSVHPAEEILEEYGFGRVLEPALTPLEEHLLVCVACQAKLEDLDECAALMKMAMRNLAASRASPAAPHNLLTTSKITRFRTVLPPHPARSRPPSALIPSDRRQNAPSKCDTL